MISGIIIFFSVVLCNTLEVRSLSLFDGLISEANIYHMQNLPTSVSKQTMAEIEALETDEELKIIVHGFTGSRTHISIKPLVDAYLNGGRTNVFVCDWEAAAGLDYHTSRSLINSVAIHFGKLLEAFVKRLDLDIERIHLIGHSLGAHIAGDIGRYFNGTLGRITGLDPALPLFTPNSNDGLHASAARFVDVIHTDYPMFGDLLARGTADFYPNFGRAPQRGCTEIDLFTATRLILEAYSCSHNRAVSFYAETVEEPQKYPTIKCRWSGIRSRSISTCLKKTKKGLLKSKLHLSDTQALTFKDALGTIQDSDIVYMGENVTRSAKGFYYLE